MLAGFRRRAPIIIGIVALLMALAMKKTDPQRITVSRSGELDLKSVEGPVTACPPLSPCCIF